MSFRPDPAARRRVLAPAALALVVACLAGSRASALPVGAWSLLGPPQGGDGVGCYDPVRHRFIQVDAQGHAWALGTDTDSSWTQLTYQGEPPRLTLASAIYDPNGDRMIVFAGLETHADSTTAITARVHALNLGGGTPAWSELFPSGSPPAARVRHSAVYDPNAKRMVVFGGGSAAGPLLNDVWALALTGAPAWSRINLAGGPAAREDHVAAFDAGRNLMLVHGGGTGGNCAYKDLWTVTFTGTPTWHFQITNGLSAPCTTDEAAVFDPVSGHMFITGRSGGSQRAVWEIAFNGPNPTWIDAGTHGIGGTAPDATASPTAALDTQRHRLIVNGGGGGGASIFVLQLGPAWRWDQVGPPDAPGNERWMAAVQDPATANPVRVSNTSHWTFDIAAGGRWRKRPMSGVPPESAFTATSIVDTKRSRIVTFGGRSNLLGVWFNEVHTVPLDGSAPWSLMPVTGTLPKGRVNCVAVYDSLRDRMLVYGGYGLGGGADSSVYALGFADSAWTTLDVGGSPPIGRNQTPAAVYDPVRDRMLMMLGGYDAGYQWQDCWALNLTDAPTWQPLAVTGPVPPSLGRMASYDALRDRVILVGSQTSTGGPGDGCRVDALTLGAAPEWVPLSSTASPMAPDPPLAFGYDRYRDRVLSWPPLWAFPFGSGPTLDLSCPADVVWSPGSTMHVVYGVSNPDPSAQFADWTLTSDRGWPGYPVTGSGMVPGLGNAPLVVPAPIPDTVSGGLNTLTLRVTLRNTADSAACSHHVHDAVTAALGSLARIDLLDRGVALTWHAPAAAGEPALVQRSDDGSAWGALGPAEEIGNGVFRYEDAGAEPGRGYAYQLVSEHDRTRALTGVANVTIPERGVFSLRLLSANPADAGWSLGVDLPGAGTATLALYDLAGRRVEAHDVHSTGAGRSLFAVGVERRLAPGVYTAVVRFRGERRSASLVLYR